MARRELLYKGKIYEDDIEIVLVYDTTELEIYKNEFLVNSLSNYKVEINKILTKLFTDTIDLDEWKHSWHIKVNEFSNKSTRDKILTIIRKKHKDATDRIIFLTEVERVLMSQKVYND